MIVQITCAICGVSFERVHSQRKYCSDECSQVGKRRSWIEYANRNRMARRLCGRAIYQRAPDKKIALTKEYQKSEKGKLTVKKSDQTQRAKAPEKITARTAVNSALMRGDLIKSPCEKCGVTDTEAHHPDYSQPLLVEWLCVSCHRALHPSARKPDVEPKPKPGLPNSRHPLARLTVDDEVIIVRRYHSEEIKMSELATEFGTTQSTISRVVKRHFISTANKAKPPSLLRPQTGTLV